MLSRRKSKQSNNGIKYDQDKIVLQTINPATAKNASNKQELIRNSSLEHSFGRNGLSTGKHSINRNLVNFARQGSESTKFQGQRDPLIIENQSLQTLQRPAFELGLKSRRDNKRALGSLDSRDEFDATTANLHIADEDEEFF